MEQLHKRGRPRFYRRVAALVCCAAVLLTPSTGLAQASSNAVGPVISLMMDGKGIITDVQPIIRNDRMLVPIRVIAETGNLGVSYDADSRTVRLTGKKQIQLVVNSRNAWVDGKKRQLDVAPVLVNGRTLVPVRFISEVLGYHVSWDKRSKVAHIMTDSFFRTHVVREGESLWKISRTYGVPVAAIQKYNQLANQTTIRTGQQLIIPPSGNSPYIPGAAADKSYLVQSGETLAAIAEQHGTTVEALVSYNRLTDTTLYVGQVLYLPPEADTSRQPLSARLAEKELLRADHVFPFAAFSSYEPFYDTYGDSRTWNVTGVTNTRLHEGIDLMAEEGTPVYAVTSGVINRIGWNSYGGWRINITSASGKYRLYYAHLSAYAPGLSVGSWVEAGQLIGFVGSTGYGAEGTAGKFEPHLHFGLYHAATNQTFNPFYYLKYWEANKTW